MTELNRISQVSNLIYYLLDSSLNVQQGDRDSEQDAERIAAAKAKKQNSWKLPNKDDSNHVIEECEFSSFDKWLYQHKLEANQFKTLTEPGAAGIWTLLVDPITCAIVSYWWRK